MKKHFITAIFVLGFFSLKAQNIRTFNNYELSTSVTGKINQVSLYAGESIQVKSPIPFRFYTGLKYSLNNIQSGNYASDSGSTLTTLKFDKTAWWNTFSVPMGVELYYNNIGIGGFHDIVSLSGAKKIKPEVSPVAENQTLQTLGFSSIFQKKQNLTGGVYVIYTISDSFSIKAGVNRITSTFTKKNEEKELGYSKLTDDSFTIGIRINIEK